MTKNKITAVLGPTNNRVRPILLLKQCFESGMIGFPLRLLARVTGEEKIIPSNAKYFLCTVESMPIDKHLEFVGVGRNSNVL